MTDSRIVQLQSVLDFRVASDLRAQLLSVRGGDVVVDGADVERIGGQCIQVLVSAARTWEADGFSFAISRASNEMRRALAHVGLQTYFKEAA